MSGTTYKQPQRQQPLMPYSTALHVVLATMAEQRGLAVRTPWCHTSSMRLSTGCRNQSKGGSASTHCRTSRHHHYLPHLLHYTAS
jgi:hypothetical protein